MVPTVCYHIINIHIQSLTNLFISVVIWLWSYRQFLSSAWIQSQARVVSYSELRALLVYWCIFIGARSVGRPVRGVLNVFRVARAVSWWARHVLTHRELPCPSGPDSRDTHTLTRPPILTGWPPQNQRTHANTLSLSLSLTHTHSHNININTSFLIFIFIFLFHTIFQRVFPHALMLAKKKHFTGKTNKLLPTPLSQYRAFCFFYIPAPCFAQSD